MTNANTIKNLYKEYKIAMSAESDVFDNESATEAEIDAAIETTVRAEDAFANALVDFTGNTITRKDVTRMMAFKAESLDSLIARLAA